MSKLRPFRTYWKEASSYHREDLKVLGTITIKANTKVKLGNKIKPYCCGRQLQFHWLQWN